MKSTGEGDVAVFHGSAHGGDPIGIEVGCHADDAEGTVGHHGRRQGVVATKHGDGVAEAMHDLLAAQDITGGIFDSHDIRGGIDDSREGIVGQVDDGSSWDVVKDDGSISDLGAMVVMCWNSPSCEGLL